ncbi:MAG: Do family serine endopeptidase [candidate division Zixibacteria bacterium]|nr:Do family serine endopeptidase [candidate division Zixibacteria bacterium]
MIQTRNRSNRRLAAVPALLVVVLISLLAVPSVAQEGERPTPLVSDYEIHTLRDLSDAFIHISETVRPTVVTVSTERIVTRRMVNPFGDHPFFERFFGPQPDQPEQREFRQRGLGSGVIVSADGLVLTNNHVVANADSIFIRTYDERRYTATIVGRDEKTDVAVLRIDADDLTPIAIGDSETLKVGEIVMAIGSPMSENLAYTVTQGIVSATGRSNVGLADYEDFIQTDAAINPGNSGGPLVNLDGELVGINTAIASRTGGFMGIGFAVPVNMAMNIMTSLVEEGRVVRGWLGVVIQDVNEQLASAMGLDEITGVLVGDVTPDSPSDKAGVEAGDVITELNGREVESVQDLRNSIAATRPGTDVTLTVIRDDQTQNIAVTLGELPGDGAVAAATGSLEELLGFSYSTLTNALAERYGIDETYRGVVVTSIDPVSAAYRAGVREGDLIHAAERIRVETEEEFNDALSGKDNGDNVLLHINRGGQSFFVAFAL